MTEREKNFFNNTDSICDEADRIEIHGIIGEELREAVNEREVVFRTSIVSTRSSGIADELPVEIPKKWAIDLKTGMEVKILGELRTRFERGTDRRFHLKLYIDVKELTFEMNNCISDINIIYLKGVIHEETVYRKTLKGISITDLLVDVNLKDGTSACIPCIAWNANAGFAAEFQVGEEISFFGRFQSRMYTKKLKDKSEQRTAYEISISHFV